MSQYSTGTVTLNTSSAAVVGVGTAWATEAAKGNWFVCQDLPANGGGVAYEVINVASNTALTLNAPWAGANLSGAPYILHRDFSPSGFAFIARDTVALDALLNRNILALEARPALLGLVSRQLTKKSLAGLSAVEYIVPASPVATRLSLVLNLVGHGAGGGADITLQFGTAAGYQTTGYTVADDVGGGVAQPAFRLATGQAASARIFGEVTFWRRQNSDRWVMGGTLLRADGAAAEQYVVAGDVSLAGRLDRFRLQCTALFDEGTSSPIVE